MTTLGRAASLRIAYASAIQDVQRLRENYNALLRDYLAATARADAAEAEVKRLRVFVAKYGNSGGNDDHYSECFACKAVSRYVCGPVFDEDHTPGCIVAEARAAQKEG